MRMGRQAERVLSPVAGASSPIDALAGRRGPPRGGRGGGRGPLAPLLLPPPPALGSSAAHERAPSLPPPPLEPRSRATSALYASPPLPPAAGDCAAWPEDPSRSPSACMTAVRTASSAVGSRVLPPGTMAAALSPGCDLKPVEAVASWSSHSALSAWRQLEMTAQRPRPREPSASASIDSSAARRSCEARSAARAAPRRPWWRAWRLAATPSSSTAAASTSGSGDPGAPTAAWKSGCATAYTRAEAARGRGNEQCDKPLLLTPACGPLTVLPYGTHLGVHSERIPDGASEHGSVTRITQGEQEPLGAQQAESAQR